MNSWDDPWVLPRSKSRLTGEEAERFEQKRNAVRRCTNTLVYFGRVAAAEWLIEESSRYSVGGRQP